MKYPGVTSLIRPGLTLQTEVLEDPLRLVTIVDLKGRALKSWVVPLASGTADSTEVRQRHSEVEAEVRRILLDKASQSGTSTREQEVGAVLFLESLRAYAAFDWDRAFRLSEASFCLLPKDSRVAQAKKEIEAKRARQKPRYSPGRCDGY
jgi:hypothetical protein